MRRGSLNERLHLGEIVWLGQARTPDLAILRARGRAGLVPAAPFHERNMWPLRAAHLHKVLLLVPFTHCRALVCRAHCTDLMKRLLLGE